MHHFRLSGAAWLLLKRLSDEASELALCSDPACYRFHIVTGTRRGEIVRNLTMEALVASGFLQRSRTSTPSYKVSGKGKLALLNRNQRQLYRDGVSYLDERQPAEGMQDTAQGQEDLTLLHA